MQPAPKIDHTKCNQCSIPYDWNPNLPKQLQSAPMKVCLVHRICKQCFEQTEWKARCPICNRRVERIPEEDRILLSQCVRNRALGPKLIRMANEAKHMENFFKEEEEYARKLLAKLDALGYGQNEFDAIHGFNHPENPDSIFVHANP